VVQEEPYNEEYELI
jgi:hypothetical protein